MFGLWLTLRNENFSLLYKDAAMFNIFYFIYVSKQQRNLS